MMEERRDEAAPAAVREVAAGLPTSSSPAPAPTEGRGFSRVEK